MPKARTPLILQAESAECGLACLLMVAGHHGHRIDLPSARERWSVSLRGSTLADLVRIGGQLGLRPRALRLDARQLGGLELPCLLHWDQEHFVVLTHLHRQRARLLDPATGPRSLSLSELSEHFSGAALELTPGPDFVPLHLRRPLPLQALTGDLRVHAGSVQRVLGLALLLQLWLLAMPLQLQWTVDRALTGQDRQLVAVLATAFAGLVLLQVVTAALRGWLLALLGARLRQQMSGRLFRHLMNLPLSWFEKRWLGDVVSRLESLEHLQASLTASAPEALVDGAMALLTLSMMFVYSPRLALLAVAAVASQAALRMLVHARQREAVEQQLVLHARQQGHFLESVRGVQCVKLFGAQQRRSNEFEQRQWAQLEAGLRVQRLGLSLQAGQGLLLGLEAAAAVGLGALLVLEGSGFSIGMLLAYLAYKTQFVQRAAALTDKLLDLRMLGLHADRVADVLASKAEAGSAEAATTLAPAAATIGALQLEQVSFRWAPGEPDVVQGLSLHIGVGESVALVGPSGCGKTTVVKLLLGLLQPTAGRISCGGQGLDEIGLGAYRAAVSGVMQDDTLFAGSIAANIALFEPQPDLAWLQTCARAAEVHEDILAMPMGYASLVGDMGSVLSGGQKQRILLARALYRRPQLLVLDEATSHLDADCERRVNRAVRALGITRLIVAHRAETIASADRVIVLGARPLSTCASPFDSQAESINSQALEQSTSSSLPI